MVEDARDTYRRVAEEAIALVEKTRDAFSDAIDENHALRHSLRTLLHICEDHLNLAEHRQDVETARNRLAQSPKSS